MTFWERYRLSKSVMKCLMGEVNIKLHLFIKFISFNSRVCLQWYENGIPP